MRHLVFGLIIASCVSGPAFAQQPTPQSAPVDPTYPKVTFGIVSFLQYSAALHEADGFNAFDVTRGYLNIEARLSDRVRFRFTPDVRPLTDANLDEALTMRLEYASLYASVSDSFTMMFGLHETPWLAFEETVNRYRVTGPFFAERLGLVPGPTDMGASVLYTRGRAQVHAGVYNGEGYGRAEFDKYKSVDGRVTVQPFAASALRLSAFYQHGWYARDRPRHVGIVMASYEQPKLAVSAQYLAATDNPFVSRDLERRGLSLFGEVRQGRVGWAVLGGLDLVDPDADDDNDSRRRIRAGAAHWRRVGQARIGIVGTFDQSFRATDSQLTDRRILAQTHVEF